jgi:hypothetical protein
MVGALPISRSAKPSATASRVQWACRGCPSLMQFPPGAAGEIENVSHTLQPSARCEAATFWYRTGLTMDSTIVRAISADSSKSNHPAGVRPSDLAVLSFTPNSTLVGCSPASRRVGTPQKLARVDGSLTIKITPRATAAGARSCTAALSRPRFRAQSPASP